MSREEIMASFPSRYITDMLITRYFNSRDPSSRESVPMTLGGGTVLQDVQHADQFGTDILHGPTFQVQVGAPLSSTTVYSSDPADPDSPVQSLLGKSGASEHYVRRDAVCDDAPGDALVSPRRGRAT